MAAMLAMIATMGSTLMVKYYSERAAQLTRPANLIEPVLMQALSFGQSAPFCPIQWLSVNPNEERFRIRLPRGGGAPAQPFIETTPTPWQFNGFTLTKLETENRQNLVPPSGSYNREADVVYSATRGGKTVNGRFKLNYVLRTPVGGNFESADCMPFVSTTATAQNVCEGFGFVWAGGQCIMSRMVCEIAFGLPAAQCAGLSGPQAVQTYSFSTLASQADCGVGFIFDGVNQTTGAAQCRPINRNSASCPP